MLYCVPLLHAIISLASLSGKRFSTCGGIIHVLVDGLMDGGKHVETEGKGRR